MLVVVATRVNVTPSKLIIVIIRAALLILVNVTQSRLTIAIIQVVHQIPASVIQNK
jgi:hypothetical protein